MSEPTSHSAPDFDPMPVSEFLASAELYLRRSDIVLCRGKSLFSRAIRWATKSQFSHAALVFLVPHKDLGFNNTFVIESVPTGVDITDLRHYVIEDADKYDIVIKRLTAPWFEGQAPRLVRGTMLDFIKADYDFATIWAIGKSVIRRMLFGVKVRVQGLEQTLAQTYDEAKPPRERNSGSAPGQFICSGFVQYGFFNATEKLIAHDPQAGAALDDVLFNPELTPQSKFSKILSTTPEQIAASHKLDWCYVITKGMVYRVHSTEEANVLLDANL